MIPNNVILRLCEEGLTQGAHYIDARILRKDVFSVSFEGSTLLDREYSQECGASIRAFTRKGVGHCSIGRITEEEVRKGIERAVGLAQLSKKDISPFKIDKKVQKVDWTQSTHLENGEEVTTMLHGSLKSGEQPELSETENVLLCMMSETHQTFVNSEGRFIETVVPRTFVTATAHKFTEGKMSFLVRESLGATRGIHDVEDEIPDLVECLYDRVKTACRAEKGTPERSPADMVLDCSAAGMILHEAVGHALEADAILAGESPFISDVGKRIAPENITVSDDATVKGHFGSYPCDADGFFAEKKVLIENGILKNYLVDLECGLALGMDSNGSGRVGGFSGFPIPRSSNMCMQGGDWDNDEILEESSGCIYMKTPSSALISPDKTVFYMESYDAYVLDDGSAKLIRNGIKVFFDTRSIFNKVIALGDTVTHFPTACMKERQVVPVSVGAPVMKLSNVLYVCSG